MRRTWIVGVLLWLAAPAGASSFSSSARGTTTSEFLALGVGARAVAMGEAYSAVADEAGALYWNPAAMTRIAGRSVTFMHSAYVDASFFDYGAYAQNLGKGGAIGAGIQYYSAGAITQTDTTGTDVGSFTPYDVALSVGYANKLDGFGLEALNGYSVGLAGKFISSKILASAQTGAVDIGVLSPAYFERLRLALTASNIGGKIKYDRASESLPLAMRIGSAYQISGSWLASLDVGLPKGDSPYAALGTEYWLPNSGAWKFAGRAGFNSQTIGSIDGFTGISFGFGIRYGGYMMDYGFVPMGGVGQAHRISLTCNF